MQTGRKTQNIGYIYKTCWWPPISLDNNAIKKKTLCHVVQFVSVYVCEYGGGTIHLLAIDM